MLAKVQRDSFSATASEQVKKIFEIGLHVCYHNRARSNLTHLHLLPIFHVTRPPMAQNGDNTVIVYLLINGFSDMALGPWLYQARL